MKTESLEDHLIRKLGPGRGSQKFLRNIIGRYIVAQKQRRLAVYGRQRRIWQCPIFVNADVVLHRGVHGGDGQHFLRPIVRWRVDVPWSQSPEPIRMFLFQVGPDFSVVMQTGGLSSLSPD